mmetsp:Transcript_29786/g.46735  ORF Transcript_29786/g.46735 Transcript_29786/m.46735 type:complete len:394 (+) Transcript_29786:192-1373(+)|eukprot:CAMPEP_0184312266 /NCGR_PEP_ID=MMETSP1049-20130417/48523_1 /TAXON_ID=77928 /ORGANISM="Proteomonas sulcata, Strain CCMP704" /LENGTH=393 /DNA_ID=CAMNT_0026628271 /DNA_START=188 /DNA_END=1369 /DNA_ORIENTATION=+
MQECGYNTVCGFAAFEISVQPPKRKESRQAASPNNKRAKVKIETPIKVKEEPFDDEISLKVQTKLKTEFEGMAEKAESYDKPFKSKTESLPRTPRSKIKAEIKSENLDHGTTPLFQQPCDLEGIGALLTNSPVFPGWRGPTVEDCQALHRELVALHGPREQPKAKAKVPVLDSLVGTILSQNTTSKNSTQAFAQLKERFPTWEEVRTAGLEDIEQSIRVAGLSKIRAKRIQDICQMLYEQKGEPTLEHLREASSDEIKDTLTKFPGIGAKTASCVLLFCLQRPDFAVDTHVFRLSKLAGWVPDEKTWKSHNNQVDKRKGTEALAPWPPVTRETTYSHLNAMIPDDLKYALHVLLIAHGRTISPASGPKDPQTCPINARAKALKQLTASPKAKA